MPPAGLLPSLLGGLIHDPVLWLFVGQNRSQIQPMAGRQAPFS